MEEMNVRTPGCTYFSILDPSACQLVAKKSQFKIQNLSPMVATIKF